MKTDQEIFATTVETDAPGQNLVLQEQLFESFMSFIENHPAERLSRNLRSVLLSFLKQEGATEVLFLQDFLFDVSSLFDLLDEVAERATRDGN